MKTIKILLASSVAEFERERKELGDYIRILNDNYMECGSDIYIKLEICGDLSNALAKESVQEEYSRKIRESDLFYIVFGKSAEAYMFELFDVALEHFKETGSPRIYTYFYFQKLPERVEAADSVKRFMERLDKEFGHYYRQISHIDDIKLSMLFEIARSTEAGGKLDIKDGKALLNGKEMLSPENAPIFKNNEELQKLREELGALRKERAELAVKFAENPEDMEVYHKLSKTADRIKEITDRLHKMEETILKLCTTIAERNSSGKPITFREKEVSRYLDGGDYEGALAILRDGWNQEAEQAEEQLERLTEKLAGYINEARLRIQTLKEKGVSQETLPEIYECYEKCENIAKKHKIETDIIYEYALFLSDQKEYEKALKKAEWLRKYYDLAEDTGDYGKSGLYNLLGELYTKTNRYAEAEEWFQKAAGPKS